MNLTEFESELLAFREAMRAMCRAEECGDEVKYDAQKAVRDQAGHNIECAFASLMQRVEALEATVPHTADGVPIVIGDRVWFEFTRRGRTTLAWGSVRGIDNGIWADLYDENPEMPLQLGPNELRCFHRETGLTPWQSELLEATK